ncbi:hypothetical protein [Oenococcus oeni]|uniref:hypothetical protein n=4 Tax=Oenococcus oeni TaxID=1247 RepID=UPI00027777D2|nr:hypothetical protein [Oenococcus oeni]EJN91648.1 hypothetical protein AWRIB304_1655 [Oenococcus oeni AWRIB304]KER91762.1 hypothetical protein HS16_01895 [Oenococcus oeni]KER96269.1 hypothetical protein HT64_04625 [Oenococcus oeni]KGH59315.1 hypothetical protein X467_09405 [Oenococcus oeni S28]KGH63757.1 hypothetical protein X294_05210 [Oenococcus oeni IOEB_CiNe]
MAITMYQSDRNFVSPANDASLYSGLSGDISGILNRGNSFNVTVDGLVATIDTGQAIIAGRLVEITIPETVTIPANSSGYICLVIDLTKTNDVFGTAGDSDYSVTVNQIYVSAIPQQIVTQDDLNNGGSVYEFPLVSFTSTATSATTSTHRAVYLNSSWQTIVPSTGTATRLQYRINNGIIYVTCNKLYPIQQNSTLFTMPSWTVPSDTMNFDIVLKNASSTSNGSGIGIMQITSTGAVTLALTPNDSASQTYYGWFSISYPIN